MLLVALWLVLIIVGIAMMQWGAQRVCALLGAVRRHWGLSETAGGTLVGMATACPEVSVNIVSVLLGWPDIGLGTALGSNVPALPLIFAISYISTRRNRRVAIAEHRDPQKPGTEPPRPLPHIKPQAVSAQVLPYLGVIALLALLTLPPAWQGLQPVDAAILAAAVALYFGQPLRRRHGRETTAFPRDRILKTLPGVLAVAAGALVSVLASRRLNDALGISDLVGGLFITGLLCALPESFAAWQLSRAGHATAAVSGAIADGTVSLTIALIPLGIAGTAIGDLGLYVLNLGFLAAVLLTYLALNHPRFGETLSLRKVMVYDGGYVAYLLATLWLIR